MSNDDGGGFVHRKGFLKGLILAGFDELGDGYFLDDLADEETEDVKHLTVVAKEMAEDGELTLTGDEEGSWYVRIDG